MNGASEKVRIIVVFADISGFTNFVDSVTNDEVEYDPLMEVFDDLIDEAARKTGYTFTDTGDGFMCTVDLGPGHNCTIAMDVLLVMWRLLKKIEHAIDRHREKSVAPDGIRMVGAAGYVKRKVKRDGRVVLRGKHINLAHNLLDLARGRGILCDNSLKQLISDDQAEKNGMSFILLKKPKRIKLWALKVKKEGANVLKLKQNGGTS